MVGDPSKKCPNFTCRSRHLDNRLHWSRSCLRLLLASIIFKPTSATRVLCGMVNRICAFSRQHICLYYHFGTSACEEGKTTTRPPPWNHVDDIDERRVDPTRSCAD